MKDKFLILLCLFSLFGFMPVEAKKTCSTRPDRTLYDTNRQAMRYSDRQKYTEYCNKYMEKYRQKQLEELEYSEDEDGNEIEQD